MGERATASEKGAAQTQQTSTSANTRGPKLVPLLCTQCGGTLDPPDGEASLLHCAYCGTAQKLVSNAPPPPTQRYVWYLRWAPLGD